MNIEFFLAVVSWIFLPISSLAILVFVLAIWKEASISPAIRDLRDYARGYKKTYRLNPIWYIVFVLTFSYLIAYYFG